MFGLKLSIARGILCINVRNSVSDMELSGKYPLLPNASSDSIFYGSLQLIRVS